MKICLLISAILLLAAPEATGATYYIDFAAGSDSNPGTSQTAPWRRAPGMNGFAGSYKHGAGDRFIFKGGVTWDSTMAPWLIADGGAPGNSDYYGVDKTWYSGASWSQPIFDGGSNPHITTTKYGYWKITGSYVTLDNLTLQNLGIAGTNQDNYAIFLFGVQGIHIENMTLHVRSRIAIEISNTTGTVLSDYEFKNNDISDCSWGIGGGSGGHTPMKKVLIHDNRFHDFHSQLANEAHGDGIYLFGVLSDFSAYMDQVYIYNNWFYGDFSKSDATVTGMNSFIWVQSPQGSAYIYNNHLTYSAGGASTAFMAGGVFTGFTGKGSVYIYNNSYVGDEKSNRFLNASNLTNLVVENNISIGGKNAYTIEAYGPVSSFTSDYNDFYRWSYGADGIFAGVDGTTYTYSKFHSAGFEKHGYNKDPRLVSLTDLRLRSSSPLIQKGLNLSSLFTTDAAGNPRPPSGPWNMGAFEVPAP